MQCGLSIASEVFLILSTQVYQYFSVFVLFALYVTSLMYSFLILPNSNTLCCLLPEGSKIARVTEYLGTVELFSSSSLVPLKAKTH